MKKLTFALAASVFAVLSAGCAGPDSLMRVHAYGSPKKDASELATVFGVWNGAGGEQTFICFVNGKSYSKMGAISNCPSVIYVPAGTHQITISYRYANYYSDKTIPITVRAGRTYRVASTANSALTKASFHAVEMPESFHLKYKDLVPMLKEKYEEKGESLVLPKDAE